MNYYYKIADLIMESEFEIDSYKEFVCEPMKADVLLTWTDERPTAGREQISGTVVQRRLADGWFYHSKATDQAGLFVSSDYSRLRILGAKSNRIAGNLEWYIRIAVECMLVRRGYLSLHAAAVEVNGEAFAFSAPSGVGKSTRAQAWIDGLNAKLVNGDRPLIDTKKKELLGVPWDGKEQCFRNVQYPLKAICEVRRCASTYIRKMTVAQRRKLLVQQCFMPMWDTDTAVIQMANISRLAAETEMVRAFCGPTSEDARTLKNALDNHQYLKEEADMKAKQGFILRNVVDEHILMPTGDNIGKFNGTVLLNEVSAFVWEKLQNPISKDDLLRAILDEFEVEKAVASADLDALLATFNEYGIIENE